MLCRTRAWLLAVCLLPMIAPSSSAQGATRVTIPELLKHPASYYDQQLELECYYDKESPIWVSALPEADEWIGFFVTGPPERVLTWTGEYYNLVFAPRDMQEAVRTLRAGDKITIIGAGFHYHSQSLDGVGIRLEQLLRGWGAAAKPVAGSRPDQPAATEAASAPVSTEAPAVAAQQAAGPTEKYAVTINGRRYTGLRFGDGYNFDGVEFQVDQEH